MKNVLMIISGRSGSSYLRTLINQDSRVLMLGEILVQKSSETQKKIINNFFSGKLVESDKSVHGFKTKLNDVIDQDYLIEQINVHNPVILINRRSNYLKQAISRARMLILLEQTRAKYGEAHHSPQHQQDVVGQIKVDVDWVYRFTQDFESRDQKLASLTDSLNHSLAHKTETVFYEEFADNPQLIISKLSTILEIDLKVKKFDTTLKNTPTDLRKAIANFEELETRLANTKYLPMLYAD